MGRMDCLSCLCSACVSPYRLWLERYSGKAGRGRPILTGKRAVHWGYGKAGLKSRIIWCLRNMAAMWIHSGCGFMKPDGPGRCLEIAMEDKPFHFSAIPYTPHELENALHREELPVPRRTVVSVRWEPCGAWAESTAGGRMWRRITMFWPIRILNVVQRLRLYLVFVYRMDNLYFLCTPHIQ